MSDLWSNILALDIFLEILFMLCHWSMTSLCLHGLTVALHVKYLLQTAMCNTGLMNTALLKCGLLLYILLSFFSSQFLGTVFKCYLWMNVKHNSQCVPPAISVRPHINITSPLTGSSTDSVFMDSSDTWPRMPILWLFLATSRSVKYSIKRL